jgi:hypothetical protein
MIGNKLALVALVVFMSAIMGTAAGHTFNEMLGKVYVPGSNYVENNSLLCVQGAQSMQTLIDLRNVKDKMNVYFAGNTTVPAKEMGRVMKLMGWHNDMQQNLCTLWGSPVPESFALHHLRQPISDEQVQIRYL